MLPVVLALVVGYYFYRNRVVDSFAASEGKYELRANGVIVSPSGKHFENENWENLKSGMQVIDTFTTNEGKYELRTNGLIMDPHGHLLRGMNWAKLKQSGSGGIL
jgi:hypothetical protein